MSEKMTNFIISLDIMWKGMLGIFAVIIIITLIVMLLSRFDNKKE